MLLYNIKKQNWRATSRFMKSLFHARVLKYMTPLSPFPPSQTLHRRLTAPLLFCFAFLLPFCSATMLAMNKIPLLATAFFAGTLSTVAGFGGNSSGGLCYYFSELPSFCSCNVAHAYVRA